MNPALTDLFKATFRLDETEAHAVLSPFVLPAGIPNDLLVGRRFGGPADIVIGGACIRNDLGGISLGTVYQLLVPTWVAAQLGIPAAFFIGVAEESLAYPAHAGAYADLGRLLREGVHRMAEDYGVTAEVIDTSDPDISEAIEQVRATLRITLKEEDSRWLYEMRVHRNAKKEPHSVVRRRATARVVACHTPSFLKALFGRPNPLLVEDVEQFAAVQFAERFEHPQRTDFLAFFPLPDLRGKGPLFKARGADRVVLNSATPVLPLKESMLPKGVTTFHRWIADMLPDVATGGPGPLQRIVTYAGSRFSFNQPSQHRLVGLRNMETNNELGPEDTTADGTPPLVAAGPVVGRRLLSGLQPSGTLHLGNFYGAMRQHIEGQRENEGFFFIATYHAMTTVKDPAALAHMTLDVALDYLAVGLDPSRVALYRQTDVPEVTELAWILGCVASVGDLERSVSYKDKVRNGVVPNVGLFTYPVLMAADILIVRAEVVPVGQDQLQHIEMTRRFASRFNKTYGRQLFAIPQAKLNEASVVPGIDGQKMSKSYGNAIPLFGDPAMVRKLLFSIRTDSTPVEEPKDPEACRGFALMRLMATPDESAQWADQYRRGGLRYSDVKQRLFELYEERFGVARERRRELAEHPDHVEEILREGARQARAVARSVMAEVREAVGMRSKPVPD